MKIKDIFLKAWSLDGFVDYCRNAECDPNLRLVLGLDGTITRALELLHLKPIRVELVAQSHTVMDPELSDFLGVQKAKEVVTRQVWLKTEARRLLYASSLIAQSSDEDQRLDQFLSKDKSLGILLEENRLPVLKDNLTIGRLLDPRISKGFMLDPATELWARHYRLIIDRHIRASVLEVLSPMAFTPA